MQTCPSLGLDIICKTDALDILYYNLQNYILGYVLKIIIITGLR